MSNKMMGAAKLRHFQLSVEETCVGYEDGKDLRWSR